MLLKEIVVTIFIIISALYTNNSVNSIINNNANNSYCVLINGGGFSGFWYYYGYLQNNNIGNKPIYCYSSGCVAYVASIGSNNYSYLHDLAINLVIDYNNKKITSYEIKEKFINIISNSNINIQNYNLNILSSNYAGQCKITKPKTVSELIVALDETTNIPLITSKLDFSKNIDGAFCITFINKCAHTIRIPYDYKIYRNIFNINMSYKDFIYFLTYTKL
jgi:hypothetical protein